MTEVERDALAQLDEDTADRMDALILDAVVAMNGAYLGVCELLGLDWEAQSRFEREISREPYGLER